MNAEADKESILPYIKMFQQLIRYVDFTVVTPLPLSSAHVSQLYAGVGHF